MLDLGPISRVAFAVAYVTGVLCLLVFGLRAPDHVFGFQMFNESSRITLNLYREVKGKRGRKRRLPISDGAWEARDSQGRVLTFRWSDRVRYRVLNRLGRSTHAAYGLDAQLFRLQRALDDVAAHISDDTETLALIAVVEATKNGRPVPPIELRGERP